VTLHPTAMVSGVTMSGSAITSWILLPLGVVQVSDPCCRRGAVTVGVLPAALLAGAASVVASPLGLSMAAALLGAAPLDAAAAPAVTGDVVAALVATAAGGVVALVAELELPRRTGQDHQDGEGGRETRGRGHNAPCCGSRRPFSRVTEA